MAEYYPLLARAVAGLKTSTPPARRAIYERARGALLAQLRAMNPPIPEPDIQRESDALDAAISRLEAENAASPAEEADALRKAEEAAQAVREAEAKAAQERTLREQERAAREKIEAEARAAEEARLAAQAKVEAEAKAAEEARAAQARREEEERLAAERAAREHAEQEARLAAEKRQREARERAAAEQAEARRREEIARERAAEAQTAAERQGDAKGQGDAKRQDAAELQDSAPPAPPPTRPQTLSVPVNPPASAPPRPEPPPPPAAPDIIVDEPTRDPAAAPPIAIRAVEPEPDVRGDPFAAFAAERLLPEDFGAAAPELEGDARNKPSRPAAPLPPPERPSHLRHILAGAALALAMAGIGYAAWVLRDKPQELPRPKTGADAPATQPAEAGGKITERIGVAPSAPVPTVQAPAQTIRPAGSPPAAPPPPPPIATPAQLAPSRAAFLIQSDGPEQHKTYSGVANWRVENGVWRADVSAPEVKLAVSFAMSKSADEGPASHKIDLRFQFDDPAYQIGRIGAPEMRKEENPYGDRLVAVAVPVTQNVYLIGLRKGDADMAYNLELIRSRNWIDIPIEMADKRIAKITFEKGPAGDATFAQALKEW